MSFLRKLYYFLKTLKKLNIVKTIIFNFKYLKVKDAVRLPIFLYGKVYIWNFSGSIVISSSIKTGMIKIGYKWFDLWPSSFLPTQIENYGVIKFFGPSIISGGANLSVENKDASIEIGEYVTIGGGSIVKSCSGITIGPGTCITGNCRIMDSNMHYIKNIESGIIMNNKKPIIIGKNCWINEGTIITKGSIVPNGCITSRNSMVNKDLRQFGENLYLVGAPAKIGKSRVQRIFTYKLQKQLNKMFEQNVEYIQMCPGLEIESGLYEGF